MLTISVIDRSAERRVILANKLQSVVDSAYLRGDPLPKCVIETRAPEEISKYAVPDIVCFTEYVSESDLALIKEIRRSYSKTRFAAFVRSRIEVAEQIDLLARSGVEDVLVSDGSEIELVGRIILWGRSASSSKVGKMLVVCGAKGGVGASTMTALVGELSSYFAKKVALIDLDSYSQDLTRFYNVSPCVNEALDSLLSGSRPISGELIKQVAVSSFNERIDIVPPAVDKSLVEQADPRISRNFLRILESLDELYDLMVVDLSCASAILREFIFRSADFIIIVTDRQVSSVPATAVTINEIKTLSSESAKIVLLVNEEKTGGNLPLAFLRQIYLNVINEVDNQISLKSHDQISILYMGRSPKIPLWFSSGKNLIQFVSKTSRRILTNALIDLELIDGEMRGSRQRIPRYVACLQSVLKKITLQRVKPEEICWDGERPKLTNRIVNLP